MCALIVEDGHRQFVLMPTESGVVKVDYMHVVACDNQIIRVQVRVDQAVGSSVFTVIGQDSIDLGRGHI